MGRMVPMFPSGNPIYDATPNQKRTITKLCIACKIKEHLEERKMTSGEAGRLIRELTPIAKSMKARR